MKSTSKRAICLAIAFMLSGQLTACATGGSKQAAPQKPCPATGCPAPQRKY